MRILAGIDGGGTRTRLALVREDGRLLGFAESGSCSFAEQGLERARAELTRLWRMGWQNASEPARMADALFMGMGSILAQADTRTNCEMAESLGFVGKGEARAENDAFCALSGGLCGRPGILLIAGTGSACFGRNFQGETWRAGGWGYRLSDVGSAYALGLAAMVTATRHTDGRESPTRLTQMVCEALGINSMAEIFRRVHYEKLDRADIAALAPQVVSIAAAGDVVARRILSENVGGLVEMVVTVATRLKLQAPELTFTGGLITNAIELRAMFFEQLGSVLPGCVIARDGFAPVLGAVFLAYERLVGGPPPVEFIQQLRQCASIAGLLS